MNKKYINKVFPITVYCNKDIIQINKLAEKVSDGIIQVYQQSTNTLINAKSLIGFLSLENNNKQNMELKLIIQAKLSEDELKAFEQYRIANVRNNYNSWVTRYNAFVRQFPSSQILSMLGYEIQDYAKITFDVSSDAPTNLFE